MTTPQPTDAQPGVRSYRRRPVDVEAVQVSAENRDEIVAWVKASGYDAMLSSYQGAVIVFPDPTAALGEWLVKDDSRRTTRPGKCAFERLTDEEFQQRYEEPVLNPLHEVGVLRTRTDALARETEALYRESLRLAQMCDRQQAEIRLLRGGAPVELAAVFEHCVGCPGHHDPA